MRARSQESEIFCKAKRDKKTKPGEGLHHSHRVLPSRRIPSFGVAAAARVTGWRPVKDSQRTTFVEGERRDRDLLHRHARRSNIQTTHTTPQYRPDLFPPPPSKASSPALSVAPNPLGLLNAAGVLALERPFPPSPGVELPPPPPRGLLPPPRRLERRLRSKVVSERRNHSAATPRRTTARNGEVSMLILAEMFRWQEVREPTHWRRGKRRRSTW